jgi:N-acetylglucosamine-6-phosphate deacetylase
MQTIKNVCLILPDRIVNEGWISFENGKLQEIGNGIPTAPSSQMIDDRGMYLAPGFIDLHVHRGHGEDFFTATPEGFITADGVLSPWWNDGPLSNGSNSDVQKIPNGSGSL